MVYDLDDAQVDFVSGALSKGACVAAFTFGGGMFGAGIGFFSGGVTGSIGMGALGRTLGKDLGNAVCR